MDQFINDVMDFAEKNSISLHLHKLTDGTTKRMGGVHWPWYRQHAYYLDGYVHEANSTDRFIFTYACPGSEVFRVMDPEELIRLQLEN